MSDAVTILRFDAFELDTAAGELRRHGDRVKLPPQPFRVLELLVRHRGEVLTRNDIRDRIWSDSFVDFEQGLNFCIRQIREALGDTADAPRFIETLPRRGYRFLLPVEAPSTAAPKAIRSLIVLPFRMLRADPVTDFLAFSLPEALTTSLSGLKSLVVRSSLAASRYAGTQDLQTIAAETHVDLIVTGKFWCGQDVPPPGQVVLVVHGKSPNLTVTLSIKGADGRGVTRDGKRGRSQRVDEQQNARVNTHCE